jgi:two-component system nitrate/nitrite response regulator NarL
MFNDFTYLYVEDDPLSREIMQMIMEHAMGVQRLTIFENSEDFMVRLQSLLYQPNLILLDIHMQPYNGFEMLEMLRSSRQYHDTRIIALTASVMNEEVEKLKHSGFDGAIGKPLSVQTFPALIERILRGERVWHVADA